MTMRRRSSMAVSSSNTNPSHLTPPRFLLGFSTKPLSDTDPTASPTSILDSKPFSSPIALPFFIDRKPRPTRHNKESGAVGLGIVGALHNERPDINMSPQTRKAEWFTLDHSLKFKYPPYNLVQFPRQGGPRPSARRLNSGLRTRTSQLALLSPALRSPTACSGMVPPQPSSDMELSEDYTCEIAHWPNPRTTHIFHNSIVKTSGICHSYVHSPDEDSWGREGHIHV